MSAQPPAPAVCGRALRMHLELRMRLFLVSSISYEANLNFNIYFDSFSCLEQVRRSYKLINRRCS